MRYLEKAWLAESIESILQENEIPEKFPLAYSATVVSGSLMTSENLGPVHL